MAPSSCSFRWRASNASGIVLEDVESCERLVGDQALGELSDVRADVEDHGAAPQPHHGQVGVVVAESGWVVAE